MPLRELHIRDFAIIDEVSLQFAPGFNVLTGETGAGKSILIQAINLLCGGRASPEVIRRDSDDAAIEGVFELTNDECAVAEGAGLPAADDLLVRRVISRSGRSRVYLNGTLANLAVLEQIGGHLVHVYGQHEHALLLWPDSHLGFLDTCARHADLCAAMAARFAELQERRARLAEVTAGLGRREQRIDFLRFQRQELIAAAVEPGEDERLQQERDLLAHAERLLQACWQSEEALYAGDDAVTSVLARVTASLRAAARIDPSLAELTDLLGTAASHVDEVAHRLRTYGERITFDPARREAVEERLALLARLKRKYGGSLDAVRAACDAAAAELAQLESGATDIAVLEREVAAATEAARAAAAALSASRREAARRLERQMVKELRALGMRHAQFTVVFAEDARHPSAPAPELSTPGHAAAPSPSPAVTRTGADTVEFHLSANPGEPARPLAKIASGGELSRIMLALKVLTAGAGEVSTLIFDEVDAGIGGAVADAVGERLRALGATRQILCITHLPQLAARAEHHIAIEKQTRRGRTVSVARALAGDERVAEISRMLGGSDGAEAARFARRLVKAEPRRR